MSFHTNLRILAYEGSSHKLSLLCNTPTRQWTVVAYFLVMKPRKTFRPNCVIHIKAHFYRGGKQLQVSCWKQKQVSSGLMVFRPCINYFYSKNADIDKNMTEIKRSVPTHQHIIVKNDGLQ